MGGFRHFLFIASRDSSGRLRFTEEAVQRGAQGTLAGDASRVAGGGG